MPKRKVIELNNQPIHQQDLLMCIDGICPCISTLIKGGTQQIKVMVNGSHSNRTNGQYDRPHI